MSQLQDQVETISLCDYPSNNRNKRISEATLELENELQLSEKRRWPMTLLVQIAPFFWMLPIIALLTLNLKKYIIGPSAYCPNQDCFVGWFNPVSSVPQSNLQSFDRRDHNLLGGLQLAAKALEIWFELISVALVYLITFHIAEKKDGLPIGFLTRPSEFSYLPSMVDPLLWRTLPSFCNLKTVRSRLRYRIRVYLFIGFTVFLCILCNLMGPATAVLAIPSLQWIETPLIGDQIFTSSNAEAFPFNNTYFYWRTPHCSSENFTNLELSCAAAPYAWKLDAWVEDYLASGEYVYGQTQEFNVKFMVNQSFSATSNVYANQAYYDLTWWAPARQMISNLDDDLQWMMATSLGFARSELDEVYEITKKSSLVNTPESYASYNRSLLLSIQRNGPILGSLVQVHADLNNELIRTTVIDNGRQIRCYLGYQLGLTPFIVTNSSVNYTKCIRAGEGWSSRNKHYDFTILGEHDNRTGSFSPDVGVSIFSSDKAQFFKDGILPSWLPPECLIEGQLPASVGCDWDRLFETHAQSDVFNRTQNVTTIEMLTKSGKGEPALRFTVDFVAFLNFTTYQVDPSPLTNPATIAQTAFLPRTGSSIYVDPAWILAAWTVNNKGVVSTNRTLAREVVHTVDQMRWGIAPRGNDSYPLDIVALLPVMQTLTLIDFNTEKAAPGVTFQNARADHPLLVRHAKMYVWAYGLGSRTSKLGFTVALLGVCVVLIQIVFGLVDRRKHRSSTQLLVAALEHVPADEFKGIEHREAKIVKTRFHVAGNHTGAGKYAFRKLIGRA